MSLTLERADECIEYVFNAGPLFTYHDATLHSAGLLISPMPSSTPNYRDSAGVSTVSNDAGKAFSPLRQPSKTLWERSRIVELTSEFRVVLPERKTNDVIAIQTLVEGKSAEETGMAWQVAIQGPSSRMIDICLRLRNEDESARNAIIRYARGEEMDFLRKCDQCHGRKSLPGGCRKLQDEFHGACSTCIFRGHPMSCSERIRDVDEENDYQPSEGSDDEGQYRTTIKKRKRRVQKVNGESGEMRGEQTKEQTKKKRKIR
ncbi:hypothetical protein BKA56DRAFT_702014 [Ilyonectria sp. MPI-CAGE-AT-0026]|nr:hypothetical protein BKA56DRAFT_702014 [Ilyonectria sp. MPI-CAGE-AT-0026]